MNPAIRRLVREVQVAAQKRRTRESEDIDRVEKLVVGAVVGALAGWALFFIEGCLRIWRTDALGAALIKAYQVRPAFGSTEALVGEIGDSGSVSRLVNEMHADTQDRLCLLIMLPIVLMIGGAVLGSMHNRSCRTPQKQIR